MYKHILVATDGTPLSGKATRAAVDLAAATGAKLTAIHAIVPLAAPMGLDGFIYDPGLTNEGYEKAMRKHAGRILGQIEANAQALGVQCDSLTVVHGQPWEAIVEAAASRHCDLIMMASHGRRGLEGLLLGSETHKVLTHAKTAVLVCR